MEKTVAKEEGEKNGLLTFQGPSSHHAIPAVLVAPFIEKRTIRCDMKEKLKLQGTTDI